jgi:2',3'-cyclic-nucleotide 2'-phosphodiesterase (5'-nucleotidase family)
VRRLHLRTPCRAAATAVIALILLAACIPLTSSPLPVSGDGIRTVTMFYTSDEHGYLEPIQRGSVTLGGAANLMAALRQRGYDPDGDDALLISGGDMWTGPAISSWFQGASAVQVFNALGYDAAAVGNHDFDFGQEVLLANGEAAAFPFLTANVTQAETGDPAEFAQPYVIHEVNGVRVAVVGLTTTRTPNIVMPAYVEGLAFSDYASALRSAVPQARAEGAELVIVAAHVCPAERHALIPVAAELSIPLLAGGHCHELENVEREGVRIVGPGAHWQAFVQVDIAFDTATGEVVGTEAELIPVEHATSAGPPTPPDAGIEELLAEWQAEVEEALGEVVGYTESGVERDWPLYNLVVDAWLWYYPEADLAITNLGGYREAIPPGEITRADIVAVLPFENTLIDVELTGKQVMDNLLCCGGVVAGLTYHRAGAHIIAELDDGSPLDPEATYHVLVNNFIYTGGDDYLFAVHNPDAYDTGIHWREPVIEWLLTRQTSPERPLETLLDDTMRGRW